MSKEIKKIESDYYAVSMWCSNCDFTGIIKFTKGELTESKCPTCDCDTLTKLRTRRSRNEEAYSNLLDLLTKTDVNRLSLRDIGRRIGVPHPETVKYYLEKAYKQGKMELYKRIKS